MPRSLKSRVYGATWRKVRRRILERDGHVCQVRGPRCTEKATTVDHIQPWRRGGAWYDEANLRASCRRCQEYAKRPWNGRNPSREW
jgi:5-methylcytosine-specific restriction enzyme A